MIERLSLNSLKFFYYVARYDSVTIAAEKLFVTQGAVSKQLKNLEEALGQYNLYQTLLEVTEPERELFLGVSEKTFAKFFAREEIKFVMQRLNVKMLVVDVDSEEVVQWIN